MRYSKKICLMLLGTTSMSINISAQKPQKPNILLFMVDDMGWEDSSVPFWNNPTAMNLRIHTPNIARLANAGMKFTQAYACAISSPSRTSLITGMNAARHHVTNWTLIKDHSEDRPDSILEFPKWNVNGAQPVNNIPQSVYATMLPQILKNNGYYTIHCGKLHIGAFDTPGGDPLNLGYDINIAGHASGGVGSYLGEEFFGNKEKGAYKRPWGVPGLEKYHGDSIFLTEAMTREAIHALDKARKTGKPFYLDMSHYAVHIPYKPDRRYYSKYSLMGLSDAEARYSSMLEAVDKSLGDFLEYLDKHNLSKQTIVIFLSDNGGYNQRPRQGNPLQTNYPLKGGKGSTYEGGLRIPLLVKWPGVVKPNSVCNEYLQIEDFFPTILDLAKVKNVKTIQTVDGRSFLPMLLQKGTTSTNRSLIWNYPNKWGESGPGIGATCTIRSGDWKLIYFYKDQHFELYNLKMDIGEKNNQAAQNQQIVKMLAIKLGTYLRKVNAQRPSYKNTGLPVPWPDQI